MADRIFQAPIRLPADPTDPLQAVTKQYVDAVASVDGGSFLDNYLVGGVGFDGGAFVATPITNHIAFLQVATGTGGASPNVGATSAGLTTVTGHTFLVLVSTYGSSAPTISLTDNKSNTYTAVGAAIRNATDGMTIRAYVCIGGTGGAGHVWTLSTSATANNYCAIMAIELSGVASVDASAQVSTTANAASITTGSFTPTNTNTAVIGICGVDASAFPAPAAATGALTLYSTVPGTAQNTGLGLSYQLLTSAAAKTAGFTGGGTTVGMCAGIFALKST